MPLESERLRLRRLDQRDIPALTTLAGDWEVARWTAVIPHPFAETDAVAYVARSHAGNRVGFAIERRIGAELIGCVGIEREGSPEDETGDIGYWIGRPYWSAGYASEAVRRTVRLAFRELGLAVLEAEVMQGNFASARVLERAGFSRVGDAIGTRGRCDGVATERYRLVRDDWAARDAAKPVVLVVAVALVDSDGRVLLAQRPEGKRMAGLWEFPGGKVAEGESPEAALIRELDEELGIDTRESCLAPFTFASHEYEDFRLLMPLFVCRVWRGTPRAREGQTLAWVRPQRMSAYPMPPADIPLIAMLCDLL
jgi:8-oxo-dGTP diphosphatase